MSLVTASSRSYTTSEEYQKRRKKNKNVKKWWHARRNDDKKLTHEHELARQTHTKLFTDSAPGVGVAPSRAISRWAGGGHAQSSITSLELRRCFANHRGHLRGVGPA